MKSLNILAILSRRSTVKNRVYRRGRGSICLFTERDNFEA